MTRLPNLELLMYKASSIFLQEEEFLLKARNLKNYEILDIEVETFPQTWGSTCTGFDITEDGKATVGGCAMTTEYTTVVHEKRTDFYLVFFGDRPCYVVHNPTKEFYEDLKDRNLASLSESKKRY
nr:MAG TPA: hypothetical protein [Caudoviricetes sp.]